MWQKLSNFSPWYKSRQGSSFFWAKQKVQKKSAKKTLRQGLDRITLLEGSVVRQAPLFAPKRRVCPGTYGGPRKKVGFANPFFYLKNYFPTHRQGCRALGYPRTDPLSKPCRRVFFALFFCTFCFAQKKDDPCLLLYQGEKLENFCHIYSVTP